MNAPERWDVVVIGAGPAGSCAAWSAAQAGLNTLLVERAVFPREKVCGCCLNPAVLGEIARMGLTDSLEEIGAIPLETLELVRGRESARLRIPRGAAVSRSVLDTLLANAACSRGATLLAPAHARVGERDARGDRTVAITTPSGVSVVAARAVIVADGLAGSSLAAIPGAEVIESPSSAIGLGARLECPLEPGVIHMHLLPGGYLGLVALPGGVVDVAACVQPRSLRDAGGPGAWTSRACGGGNPALTEALAAARWTGTPRLTRRRAHIELPGILVAGDSAGYVEPFTGEGISWAMHAGLAAGAAASRLCNGNFREGEWRQWWGRELGPRRAACAAVRSTLRQPLLARGIVGLASAWPGIGAMVAGRFGAPWRAGVPA
ncbi:MAG: NAD(P)/FAD-dependent oxidoreductase [Phycisphaerales bacterium]